MAAEVSSSSAAESPQPPHHTRPRRRGSRGAPWPFPRRAGSLTGCCGTSWARRVSRRITRPCRAWRLRPRRCAQAGSTLSTSTSPRATSSKSKVSGASSGTSRPPARATFAASARTSCGCRVASRRSTPRKPRRSRSRSRRRMPGSRSNQSQAAKYFTQVAGQPGHRPGAHRNGQRDGPGRGHEGHPGLHPAVGRQSRRATSDVVASSAPQDPAAAQTLAGGA